MSTQPVPKKSPPIVAIKQYVEARANNLERVMRGTGLNLDRFLTLALNQTLQNPLLLECSKESWFDALQKCATHGLLPDGIHGALVPYKGKVQFQPMYQGLVQRAYATKAVSKLWAEVVYGDERFDVQLGDDPKLLHVPGPDRGDPARLAACYACAKVNGETHFVVLFPKDVARHRSASKTAGRSDGPWATHTAEMWKKTAIIVLSKTLPHFTPEAQQFAEVVDESERADHGDDVIDVSVVESPEDKMDAAKERLRASAPPQMEPAHEPHEPTEAEVKQVKAALAMIDPGPREPGSDDEVLPRVVAVHDAQGCYHVPLHGRMIGAGKTVVCVDCHADVNVVQLRAAEGRYANAKGGK